MNKPREFWRVNTENVHIQIKQYNKEKRIILYLLNKIYIENGLAEDKEFNPNEIGSRQTKKKATENYLKPILNGLEFISWSFLLTFRNAFLLRESAAETEENCGILRRRVAVCREEEWGEFFVKRWVMSVRGFLEHIFFIFLEDLVAPRTVLALFK